MIAMSCTTHWGNNRKGSELVKQSWFPSKKTNIALPLQLAPYPGTYRLITPHLCQTLPPCRPLPA